MQRGCNFGTVEDGVLIESSSCAFGGFGFGLATVWLREHVQCRWQLWFGQGERSKVLVEVSTGLEVRFKVGKGTWKMRDDKMQRIRRC